MHTPESYYFGALKRALGGDLEGAFYLQEKAEEAREAYGLSFSEAVSEDFPFVEEAVTTLLSSYDFTRCVKPNGKVYGTSGKCRQGTESAKPVLTDIGSKKSSLRVKTSVSDGSGHRVPGYSPQDASVHHKGRTYSSTGVRVKIAKTKEPAREYQAEGERRVFVTESGKLYED